MECACLVDVSVEFGAACLLGMNRLDRCCALYIVFTTNKMAAEYNSKDIRRTS